MQGQYPLVQSDDRRAGNPDDVPAHPHSLSGESAKRIAVGGHPLLAELHLPLELGVVRGDAAPIGGFGQKGTLAFLESQSLKRLARNNGSQGIANPADFHLDRCFVPTCYSARNNIGNVAC
jgi:hypothetical protein